MDNTILLIVGGIAIGAIIGFIVAKMMERNNASKLIKNAKKSAAGIIKEAKIEGENLKKEKELKAKERFLELKSEHEKVISSKNKKMSEAEKRTRDKESQISSELSKNKKLNNQLEQKEKDYSYRIDILEKKQSEVDKLHKSQIEQLEVISSLSAEDAKSQLVESLKGEAKNDAMAYIQGKMEEAKLTAQQDAKKIIINTIQRIGTEEAVDNCVSVFNIESDDVKGRIIGREGRNIRAIEAATGVEIIVDDTPEAIILSCFDSVRREIARLSLHKLVTDGRIHPARIEEVVRKTQKQIEQEIIEVGKRTVIDLGIHGLNPELIKMVGRMKYRSSYGQNLLQHSREVAKLCGVMAAELGLNPCDAISGARPGARRQVLDSYIQRLKDLEDIAFGFKGVKKAYAIQAGRELRVIVESEKVSDDNAADLSFNISQKIQTDMTYPGQVKVTVIRETRAVNIAK